MADYFTHLSFEFEMPSEKAAGDAVDLMEEIIKRLDESWDADDGTEVDWTGEFARFKEYEFSPDLCIEADGKTVWIRDDCGGPNIDLLCDYLQLVLQRFDPPGAIGFEWSGDCSKHRCDAFGGGAAFITAEKIDYINGWQWLTQKREAWAAEHGKAGEVQSCKA